LLYYKQLLAWVACEHNAMSCAMIRMLDVHSHILEGAKHILADATLVEPNATNWPAGGVVADALFECGVVRKTHIAGRILVEC
jgi:hypothetical protein